MVLIACISMTNLELHTRSESFDFIEIQVSQHHTENNFQHTSTQAPLLLAPIILPYGLLDVNKVLWKQTKKNLTCTSSTDSRTRTLIMPEIRVSGWLHSISRRMDLQWKPTLKREAICAGPNIGSAGFECLYPTYICCSRCLGHEDVRQHRNDQQEVCKICQYSHPSN